MLFGWFYVRKHLQKAYLWGSRYIVGFLFCFCWWFFSRKTTRTRFRKSWLFFGVSGNQRFPPTSRHFCCPLEKSHIVGVGEEDSEAKKHQDQLLTNLTNRFVLEFDGGKCGLEFQKRQLVLQKQAPTVIE